MVLKASIEFTKDERTKFILLIEIPGLFLLTYSNEPFHRNSLT